MRTPAAPIGFALAVGQALALPSQALAREEIQPWPTIIASVPVAGKWLGSVEIINRVVSDSARPSQLEARFQLGRPLGAGIVAWAGYVRVTTYHPGAPAGIENQAVEQLNWAMGRVAGVQLSTRTRLEQRFIRGADGTAWRVREQLRLAMPLAPRGPALVAWGELYITLNRTSATRTTFDQLRAFVGVSVPVSPQADVEIGYLKQHLHRVTGDVSNDAIPMVLTMRF